MDSQVEARKKLIAAATELFATNGYKGTSIRDIARPTGMTVYNTYYHFGSKYGLLLAVIDKLATQLRTDLQRIGEMDLAPLDRFKELVRAHLGRLALDRNKAGLFFLDEEALTPAANEVNKQFQLTTLNIYRRELRSLQAAGSTVTVNI